MTNLYFHTRSATETVYPEELDERIDERRAITTELVTIAGLVAFSALAFWVAIILAP